jgi:hypothetical protein
MQDTACCGADLIVDRQWRAAPCCTPRSLRSAYVLRRQAGVSCLVPLTHDNKADLVTVDPRPSCARPPNVVNWLYGKTNFTFARKRRRRELVLQFIRLVGDGLRRKTWFSYSAGSEFETHVCSEKYSEHEGKQVRFLVGLCAPKACRPS